MKKMLVKAVALSLVMGGVGFVANDAQASPWDDMQWQSKIEGSDARSKQNAKDIVGLKGDVATNKDNITKNEKDIATNKAIATKAYGMAQTEQFERNKADIQIREDMKKADKDLSDRIDANKTIATKAYGMAQTEQVERKIADLQIREDMKKADKDLSDKIDKETNERKFGEFALNTKINAEAQARVTNDQILKGKIDAETADRKAEVARLDGEVSRLDSRIDKLDANVEKVGAMAAAIANLHTMGYDPEAPTEIAVGVGQYRDKTGMALGAFHYPNRDFMLSFSVSTAGDEFMGGIGATWKFGRKSPEELRQAEAEKAAKAKLAKAEAAKKAAKDARVAAQQKRHAEMLAARTGK